MLFGIFSILFYLISQPVAAISVSAPAQDADGGYTVSWNGHVGSVGQSIACSPGYQCKIHSIGPAQLFENNAGPLYSGVGSAHWVGGRNNGAYTYKLKRCYTYRKYISYGGQAINTTYHTLCPEASTTTWVVKPPAAPGTPTADTLSCSSLNVNWNASGGAVSGYEVHESIAGGSYQSAGHHSSTTQTLSGRDPDTAHTYKVRAYYSLNNITEYSAWSPASAAVTTPNCPPDPPGAIQLQGTQWVNGQHITTANAAFDLSWSAAGGLVHHYKLLDADNTVIADDLTALTYNTTAGAAGNTQTFKVRACNTDSQQREVCGEATETISVTVPYPAPDAPVLALDHIDTDDRAFSFSWAAPAGTVAHYQLHQRAAGDNAWSAIHETDALAYTLDGFENGEYYEFALAACNADVCSDLSPVTTHKMPELPPSVPGVPGDVHNLRESTSGDYPILWGTSTGVVTHYEIEETAAKDNHTTLYTANELFIQLSDQPNDLYHYRVRGCNVDGCSPWGQLESVVVVRAPDAPAAPTAHNEIFTDPGPALGETFNGVLTGEPQVDASGAFTYRLPIAVPPGTAGVAPKLSLDYSSQGRNGIAGMGGSLGGLSVITRCPQSRAQDGAQQALSHGANDRYCLDGQKLIAETGGDYHTAGMEYRTEQNSFSRITAHGHSGSGFFQTSATDSHAISAPGSFTVETKSGEILYYGARADAQIRAAGLDSVVVWALNRVEDTFGNYMDFHYTQPGAGEYQLDRIDYTGNLNTGATPYHSIQFQYENRPDQRFAYIGGAQRRISQRLRAIQTPVGTYTLTYAPADGVQPSRLSQIDYCVNNSACIQPIAFQWSSVEHGWQADNRYAPLHNLVVHQGIDTGVRLIDINADGRVDQLTPEAVYINTGDSNNLWDPTQYPPLPTAFTRDDRDSGLRIVELNGDGLPDLLQSGYRPAVTCEIWETDCTPSSGTVERAAWLNTGQGWAAAPSGYSNTNLPAFVMYPSYSSARVQLIDLDQDGRTDILHGHGTTREAWRNTGSGWALMPDWAPPLAFVDSSDAPQGVQLLDVNGDGQPDLVQGRGLIRNTWLNTGNGWAEGKPLPVSFIEADYRDTGLRPADINGDGLIDLLKTRWTGANSCRNDFVTIPGCEPADNVERRLWLTTGADWDETEEQYDSQIPGIIDTAEEDQGVRFADLNGDGLTDVISHQGAWLNTGTGWYEDNSYGSPVAFAYDETPNNPTALRGQATQLIDINGDGLIDILHGKDNNQQAWLNRGRVLQITGITDGYDDTIQIDYGHLSDSTVYTPVRDGQHVDLVTPLSVVKQLHVPNGRGETLTTDYQYRGLKASVNGRGSLGFQQLIITDALGIQTTTTFAQGYPYTGQPVQIETRHTGPAGQDDRLLNRRTIQYCYLEAGDSVSIADGDACPIYQDNLHDGWVFVYPYLQTETDFRPGNYESATYALAGSADSSTITTFTRYDNWGNATDIDVQTLGSDGVYARVQTENHYGSDTLQQLGRLHRATVTTTHPDSTLTVRTTAFDYDPDTTLLNREIIEPDGGPDYRLQTDYQRDAYGNITLTTVSGDDGSGQIVSRNTHTVYTTNGRFPQSTTNAVGETETYIYDPHYGHRTRLTGPNGIHTCWEYDAFGRPTAETVYCESPVAQTTQTAYYWTETTGTTVDVQGNNIDLQAKTAIQTTPPTGLPARVYADARGREVRTLRRGFKGQYILSDTLYDIHGRTIAVSEPFFDALASDETHLLNTTKHWTTTDYDPLGRIITTRQPLGDLDGLGGDNGHHTQHLYYNGFSTRREQTVNGQLRVRTETQNGLGQTAAITDALNHTIQYQHDANSKLRQTTDPEGNIITLSYDTLGRKTQINDPDMGQWTYRYNAFGELIEQTDAKAQITRIQYDALGRMTQRTDRADTADAQINIWEYHDHSAPAGSIGKLKRIQGAANSLLHSGSCGNMPSRDYHYTAYGRLQRIDACIDGQTYQTDRSYDAHGRLQRLTYPEAPHQAQSQRLQVQYHYNPEGYLHYLSDPNDNGRLYWRAEALNAKGQLATEQARNGVRTTSDYNSATGWLLMRHSEAHTDTAVTTHNRAHIQRSQFQYDEAGNLLRRARADDHLFADTVEETFSYDALDRLTGSTVTNQNTAYTHSTQIDYDALGNITERSDIGHYSYNQCSAGARAAGPHAVCAVGTDQDYQYDANGNLINGGGRSISYSPFNKPVQITHHGRNASAEFAYGADRARILRITDDNFRSERIRYIGLGAQGGTLYEHKTVTETGIQHNLTEHLHFLYAGDYHNGHAFAMHVITHDANAQAGANTATGTEYFHRDHLGSVIAITDDTGVMFDAADQPRGTLKSYDAWGKRRNPDWSEGDTAQGSAHPNDQYTSIRGHLCYTGHEAITEVGLIHMNGRVYDPEIGRFLSPDPHVQFNADLQNYNRYTYVNNNPLKYTDPSGYFIKKLFRSAGKFFNTDFGRLVGIGLTIWGGIAAYNASIAANTTTITATTAFTTASGATITSTATISVTAAGAGATAAVAAGAASGAISGAMAGLASEGTFEGAVKGSVQAATLGAISAAVQAAFKQGVVNRILQKPKGSSITDGLPDIEVAYNSDLNPNVTIADTGDSNLNIEQANFEFAVEAQARRVRSILRGFNDKNGLLANSHYSNHDIGGFITKGTSIFSRKPTAANYTLEDIGIRSPLGLVEKPGLFNRCMGCPQKGSAALVIGVKPGSSIKMISNRTDFYLKLSRRINAPVFVYLNGSEAYKFHNGSSLLFRPRQ